MAPGRATQHCNSCLPGERADGEEEGEGLGCRAASQLEQSPARVRLRGVVIFTTATVRWREEGWARGDEEREKERGSSRGQI